MTNQELLATTNNLLTLIEKGVQLPSFSSTIQRLMQLGDGTNYAAHELAAIILEDYGLISKVLSTVNSFYYNRTGREITTVTQAVITLGFDVVKELAISMAILDVAARRKTGLLPKLLAQAFWAAHLMLEIEKPKTNEEMEEIFLATLFFPLAKIVAAIVDEKSCARLLDEEREADEQNRQTLKRCWQKLGRKIAEHWSMPVRITRHMEGAVKAETDALRKLQREIKCTHDYVNANIFNANDVKQGLTILIEATKLSQKTLTEYVVKALEITAKEHEVIKETLNAIDMQLDIIVDVEERPEKTSQHPSKDMSMLSMIADMTEIIMQPQVSINDIYMMAIEIVIRGMGLETVALCLMSKDRQSFVVRLGAGTLLNDFKQSLNLAMSEPGSFLDDFFAGSTEKIYRLNQLPSLDARFANRMEKVCLSPLVVKGRTLGLFMFVKSGMKADFSSEELLYLRNIRNLMALATEQRTGKKS